MRLISRPATSGFEQHIRATYYIPPHSSISIVRKTVHFLHCLMFLARWILYVPDGLASPEHTISLIILYVPSVIALTCKCCNDWRPMQSHFYKSRLKMKLRRTSSQRETAMDRVQGGVFAIVKYAFSFSQCFESLTLHEAIFTLLEKLFCSAKLQCSGCFRLHLGAVFFFTLELLNDAVQNRTDVLDLHLLVNLGWHPLFFLSLEENRRPQLDVACAPLDRIRRILVYIYICS